MASKMAPDLLNQVTNEFRGDALNRIASAIGVSPAKAQTALSSLVPAILSGLASKASTAAGAKEVIDVNPPKKLASLNLAQATPPEEITKLAKTGRALLGFALRGRREWCMGVDSRNTLQTHP